MTKGALIVLAVCGMAATYPVTRTRAVAAGREFVQAVRERLGSPSLKTLAVAEAGFRSNDRDSNVIQDFWTADIVGLYVIRRRGPAGWIARLGDWLNGQTP